MSELETPVGNRTASAEVIDVERAEALLKQMRDRFRRWGVGPPAPLVVELVEALRTMRAERDAAVARVTELEAAIAAHQDQKLAPRWVVGGAHDHALWSLVASAGAPGVRS